MVASSFADHADVVDVFLVAAMLDDHLSPALGMQRAFLAEVGAKVDLSGLRNPG